MYLMNRLAPIALLAVGYYGLSRLGLLFVADEVSIAAVWPASGLLLGVLAVSRRSDWPSLLAAAFVANVAANLHGGNEFDASVSLGVVNMLEAGIAALVLTRLCGSPVRLESLRQFGSLLLGSAVAANAITALLGAAVVTGFFETGFWRAWSIWAAADGIGMAVVAPVVVLLYWQVRERRVRDLVTWEAGIALGMLAAVTAVTFYVSTASPRLILDFPYPLLPILIFIAIRMEPVHTAIAGLTLAAIASPAAIEGLGPFARESLSQAEQILEFQGFVGVFVSVALLVSGLMQELRRGNIALEESARQARSVIERADDAFVSIDQDGIVVGWNDAAGQLFGWGSPEALGRRLSELIIPPEFRILHERGLRRYVTTGETTVIGRPLEFEALDREGASRAIELTVSALPQPDGRTEFSAVIRDIEARKEIERERQGERELLERAVDAVYRLADEAGGGTTPRLICELVRSATETDYVVLIESTGGSHRYTAASGLEIDPGETPSEGAVLALESREPLFVKDIHADARVAGGPLTRAGAVSAVWQPMIRRGRVLGLLEVGWSESKAAIAPHFLATLGLFGSSAASALERAALLAELTDRQGVLQSQQEELARSNKELEQFGSMVSHDLSTPLRTISGRMGMLKRRHSDELSPKAVEMVDAAATEVDRLGNMLASLMRYSKVGGEEVNRRDVDLQQMAEEAIASLEPIIELAKAKVKVKGSTLPIIQAEPSLVRELLQNLISNSVRHGGPAVEVEIEGRLRGSERVFVIRDNGPGIPESERERLFKIFARGSEAEGEGDGIGLAICALVVKKHGGKIWVEDGRSGGAEFHFTLTPPGYATI